MLTLFTTTKDFVGQNKVNQVNAIKSWRAAPYSVEIVVFGESEGLEEVVDKYSLIHVSNIKASQTNVPLINAMFSEANSLAAYDMVCFINSDIILPYKFFTNIHKIHTQVKKEYLIVGQRLDVDVEDELIFENGWEKNFFSFYSNNIKVHPAYGSDFFVFPKGQYPFGSLPDLLVGRPGWDLWMIYNARKRNLKTIDLSFAAKVIHQNHNYSHKNKIVDEKKRREDDEVNYQYFKADEKYIYILEACNYCFVSGKLKRNFAKGNIDKFLMLEQKLHGDRKLYMLKVTAEAKLIKIFKK